MTQPDPLHLDLAARRRLWAAAGDAIESYYQDVQRLGSGGPVELRDVEAAVRQFDFDQPLLPEDAVELAIDALRRLEPHDLHPRHFGLFDPAPTAMGVVAEALAAAFNPCLASFAGSPFGVATERHLVRTFGQVFGYETAAIDGTVTSGGSEANLTSVLLALERRFPGYREAGLRAAPGPPVIYATRHAHPSILKAAVVAGLGTAAVRDVPVDSGFRMDARALSRLADADQAAGSVPLLVLATAGTTDAGIVDPIPEVTGAAVQHGLWVHVDAAWGGAAILVPEIREVLTGIERADSIAFDPHKWLSVPMGCGLLINRHPGLLDRAFGVTVAFLAGREEAGLDPHTRSIRWSRSFAGLKLLLSLAVAGWSGYREALGRQASLADLLRRRLVADGWELANDTPLPVVCFADPSGTPAEVVADAVNETGQARIFPVQLGDRVVLRACVTNYATTSSDIDLLVQMLGRARTALTGQLSTSAL
jgi:aromatic-L-amino-acid/L-tryptophan decarboxylase